MGLKWAKPDQPPLPSKPTSSVIRLPASGGCLALSETAHTLFVNTLLKVKNRIITFRVTDTELVLLKSASDLSGARCLSDYARTVMLRAAGSVSKDGDGHIEDKIHSLTGRLASVESDLLRVLNVINKLTCAGEVCPQP